MHGRIFLSIYLRKTMQMQAMQKVVIARGWILKRSVIDESDVEPPEGEIGGIREGGQKRATKEGPAIEV